MPTTIQQNIAAVTQRIACAAKACGRDPQQVTLLAVSKTKPVTQIEQAIAAGLRRFGENYVQEGIDKIFYFAGQPIARELEWHFIGPLQSNKSRLVAEHFDWIHTIDRERIARRLNEQRPEHLPPLNVLIQINISQEESKSGITREELATLAEQIADFPRLKLRGLMVIPAPEQDMAQQLSVFQQVAALFVHISNRYPDIDTLSMGMSDDMDAAIAAGSTMVRIGSAIFGQRDYSQDR